MCTGRLLGRVSNIRSFFSIFLNIAHARCLQDSLLKREYLKKYLFNQLDLEKRYKHNFQTRGNWKSKIEERRRRTKLSTGGDVP